MLVTFVNMRKSFRGDLELEVAGEFANVPVQAGQAGDEEY